MQLKRSLLIKDYICMVVKTDMQIQQMNTASRIMAHKKEIRSHVSNSGGAYDFYESFKCSANYAGNT